ncbi:MAG: hypothetical protein HFH08_03105 [Bacilli bacterium]|nr:hypothetical protein [Bacilli bacterium]
MKNNANNILNNSKEIIEKSGTKALQASTAIKNKAVEKLGVSKEQITKTIDQNGDGQITIEDIIIMGLKIPGVKINRSEFLKKEFSKYYDEEIVNQIIKYNPAHENIPLDKVDKIADDIIQYERLCVSGISTALSVPGGIAMAATLPTDIAQYYGYMIRAMQKLLYLYGFPDIEVDEEQLLDSATLNTIIICMGVMYGVASANIALKSMAKALGVGVEKQLLKKALTKGTIYPIVKQVAKWFNVRMTKEIFAGFFKKSIPVVGGVIGGGITYFSFKPCCEKLKETLRDTKLSNPDVIVGADIIEI